MAQISASQAALRIMGEDDLDPTEITELLGCEPSFQHKKGQELFAPKSGTRIARFGMWYLEADWREPEDIDGQVSELLDKLSNDLTVWADLSARFKIDLFVGLEMKETNEGLSISPETLRKLGERGIELGLDIYGVVSE